MSNATRGTVLAGRYRLEDRYHAGTDSSVWRAADLTLDRPVTVRVMRPGHPYSADVADAARRAALIDDPRLVRVLDVGTHDDITFVVSADIDGDSVATLIERAPLDPPVVRRIVGEVAQGLRGAAARGLHHLRLTPRSVIVTYDNTIKISGVAVEAAAAGIEPAGASEAGRTDAVALIALLYAGLTGRWPLADTGFAPAPRANDGGPIAPTELIPDIPGDLNRLCLLTLGALDSGPHSPAEVVGMLSPWPSAEEAPLRSASRPRPPVASPPTPNPALVMRSRSQRGQTPASGFRPGGPVSSGPLSPATAQNQGSIWPSGGGENLFDPRRHDREVGIPDPDATMPPTAVPRELLAPPGTSGSPSAPASRPEAPRSDAARQQPVRRTASLFPTPSVAITGSMPLPPRVRGNERKDRTDAMFGGGAPAGSEPAGDSGAARPDAAPARPRQPVPWTTASGRSTSNSNQAGSPSSGGAPGVRPPEKRQAAPRLAQPPEAPLRPQSPQRPSSPPPAPEAHPAPRVRRTASIFPTPSVAMTGSMPLPPRPKGSSARTDALFGVQTAANTDLTPAPMRDARNALAPAPAEQPPAGQPARPAQFAQPPRTTPSRPNPLDSGPIPTAAAARTAAGLRAGRPTSRPIGTPDQPLGQGSGQGSGQAVAPGSPPSLFASASAPTGDARADEVAPDDARGQHSGMGSEREAGPGRHRGPAAGRGPAAAASRLPWEQGWSNNPHAGQPPSPLESSGPFPIVIPPEAPPKNQSRKVLFGIVGVFLVLLLVAAWQLRGLVTGGDDEPVAFRESGPRITTRAANTSEPVESASAAASATPGKSVQAEPVKVDDVRAIDPEGDGDENSADAPLVVDGKKGTVWQSNWYGNAKFGGLKKGLGLAIELRRSAAVSSAEIDAAGKGGRVQLRSSDEPDYDDSKLIGSGKFEGGSVTVDVKDDVDPAKYVILWFTELPYVEGEYRLDVSEVRLT
ncbi:hypothetical protein [Kineosporia succinea]|uniref:Protein kinase domain-containing protein n=1 Tax=Kineosporia succinea TaxID=84632 RepID=A0ABT9P145_9ACTN|nr:hypothetical protein [Kineosporia succinea]MDP9826393.1 hypothetical protein [Kineosporia succinea]